MNKASLAVVGFSLLALAACGRGDQNQLNATDANAMENLDDLSNAAANLAAEADALEDQAANLEQEAQTVPSETPADENIAGM